MQHAIPHRGAALEFFRTSNPAHIRVLAALIQGPQSREALDTIAGTSNSPDAIYRLRAAGLALPCVRVPRVNRDGNVCSPGVYSVTPADRRKIRKFMKRGQE